MAWKLTLHMHDYSEFTYVWHRPLLVMWFFKNKCWIMITILAGIHACFQNTLKRNHKSYKLYFGVPEAKMTLIKTLYVDMAYLRTKMEGLNMNYNSGPHKHNHVLRGAHRGQNQPVPLRGINAFCYGVPKICPDFHFQNRNKLSLSMDKNRCDKS